MGVLEIIGSLLMLVGCVFSLTGSAGVLRLPDFYSRLHPSGKTDTLGQLLILSGLSLFAAQQVLVAVAAEEADAASAWLGYANILLKVLMLSFLLLVTAPTATHAITKAARIDRHTKIPVHGDPAESRVQHIAVDGDITRRLDETPHQVLDVIHDEASQSQPSQSSQPSQEGDAP
jgi:multicomponent Na+:H+ antiporter subunit G